MLLKRFYARMPSRTTPGTYPPLSHSVGDGLTLYDLDLFETVGWLAPLLSKLCTDNLSKPKRVSVPDEDSPNTTDTSGKTRQVPASSGITLQKTIFYTHNFTTKPPPPSHSYILDLKTLAMTPAQRHTLLVLCRERLEVERQVVVLRPGEVKGVLGAVFGRSGDKGELEVEEGCDFTHVPLDLSGEKVGRRELEFPVEWGGRR